MLNKDGNKVFTWGRNNHGQLGSGTTKKESLPLDITEKFDKNPKKAEIVCSGRTHSSLIFSDGEIWTWGGNEYGQLGRGSRNEFEPNPGALDCFTEDIIAVSCGHNQTMFLTASRIIYMAGCNDSGQLGVNIDAEIVAHPEQLFPIDDEPSEIHCSNFNIALCESGNLYIWGSTPNGLFTHPEKVNGLEGIISQAAIGESFIAVLDVNNFLYTWGANDHGQLGLGDTDPQKDACSVDALNDRKIVSLCAGKDFMMVIGAGEDANKDEPYEEEYEEIESEEEAEIIEENMKGESFYHHHSSEAYKETNLHLKNSITEVYQKQQQRNSKEALYNIDEVEALQFENEVLRQAVSVYELTRQDLIKMLGLVTANSPQLWDNIPTEAINTMVNKETHIEKLLSLIGFDVAQKIKEFNLGDLRSFEEDVRNIPGLEPGRYDIRIPYHISSYIPKGDTYRFNQSVDEHELRYKSHQSRTHAMYIIA